VVVIDSFSSDNTVKIALDHEVAVLFQRGLASQRMRGIAESRGDYILLLDSDQVVVKDLIVTCVSKLETDNSLDGLVIPEKPIIPAITKIGRAQSNYLMLAHTDSDAVHGTALPRFFRSRVLKRLASPKRELGYFDHAWVHRRVVGMGSKISTIDSNLYHLEFNTTSSLANKFYRYYGRYLVPALASDWQMVLGKLLPKPMSMSSIASGNRLQLLFLFCVKSISVTAGVVSSLVWPD
jgi:glycosyltransferase involved in cell wall biosynthesis